MSIVFNNILLCTQHNEAQRKGQESAARRAVSQHEAQHGAKGEAKDKETTWAEGGDLLQGGYCCTSVCKGHPPLSWLFQAHQLAAPHCYAMQ
jgi:hypothetical protein